MKGGGKRKKKMNQRLDINRLQETSMNDKEFEAELLETFENQINKQLNDLASYLSQQNWNQSHQIAHTIKGTSLQLGGNEIAEICKNIENDLGHPRGNEEYHLQSSIWKTHVFLLFLKKAQMFQRKKILRELFTS